MKNNKSMKNCKIEIDNFNKAFPWTKKNNIYSQGFILTNNKIIQGKELCNTIEKITNNTKITEIIKKIDGLFSIIIKKQNNIYIISDKTRTFPLFYKNTDNQIIITNTITKIAKNTKINPKLENEYLGFGYNINQNTIFENIYQTQASEIIIFTKNKITKTFYYRHTTEKNKQTKNINEKITKATKIIHSAFKKLIPALENSTIILPLSGGYDSRLIAVLLKIYNFKNVICYTYGKKSTKDIKISKKVAEKLNFKWYYIEYSNNLKKKYFHDKDFQKYNQFVSKNISFPYLQEFFALKYLTDNKIIPKNSIFIPGHSGDTIAGSHLKKKYQKINFAKTIYKKNFILTKKQKKNKTRNNQKIAKF